jgi:hypothetical protein
MLYIVKGMPAIEGLPWLQFGSIVAAGWIIVGNSVYTGIFEFPVRTVPGLHVVMA